MRKLFALLAVLAFLAAVESAVARSFSFRVSDTAHTTVLPGRAIDFRISIVEINRKADSLFATVSASGNTMTLYGDGVVIRFTQHDRTARVRAVAVNGHPLITIIYYLRRGR